MFYCMSQDVTRLHDIVLSAARESEMKHEVLVINPNEKIDWHDYSAIALEEQKTGKQLYYSTRYPL